jgi:hypothetical protein
MFFTQGMNDLARQMPHSTHQTALLYWLRHFLLDSIINPVSFLLWGPLVHAICHRLVGCGLTWLLEA